MYQDATAGLKRCPQPMACGLMFHHFSGGGHPQIQGAITADQLRAILWFVGIERILPSAEWRQRVIEGRLASEDVCLTFDDNLRSQIDIALPVLKEFGLTAFWFPYTAPLVGEIPKLEIYRFFRNTGFDGVDSFYGAFDSVLREGPFNDRIEDGLRRFDAEHYLAEYGVYSTNDRRFRFIRDELLGPRDYEAVMDTLLDSHGCDIDALARLAMYDATDVRALSDAGHVIGLHSHSHPTRLAEMPADRQRQEYLTCRRILADIVGHEADTMSHPNNSYGSETLDILAELGVRVGFRSNLALGVASPLELPRQDHAVLAASL